MSWQPRRTTLKASRHGITLLEVLISIMIMTIGVLSVAVLLPLGAYQVGLGRLADRASTIGQSAVREFRVRGFANPANWQTSGAAGSTFSGSLPVCFDPWMVVTERSPGAGFAGMARLTFPNLSSRAAADQIFTSNDDLTFDRPTDGETRPTQLYLPATGAPLKRQATGNYSWMAIISPAAGDDGKVVAGKIALLSIVVFSHRSKDPSSDVSGSGNLDGFGNGTLTVPSNSNIRPGSWAYGSGRWFRIVAVDSSGTTATLLGPSIAASGASFTVPDGVIGVYEKTIRLEGSSSWSL